MVLYFHRNPLTFQVFYVGIGKDYKRANRFSNRNAHWNSYVKKYGNPIVDIILNNLSKEQVCKEEIYFINYFGLNNLTNKSIGGEISALGMKHSDETIKKFKERKRTKEQIEKTRLKNIGKKRSKQFCDKMKQIARNPEVKEKVINSLIGRKCSTETRKKMSQWQIGRKLSEETKEKIRIARTGTKLSESHKKNISIGGKNRKNKKNAKLEKTVSTSS